MIRVLVEIHKVDKPLYIFPPLWLWFHHQNLKTTGNVWTYWALQRKQKFATEMKLTAHSHRCLCLPEEFCLWLWRRLIHVKSYLRGNLSYYGSGICIYRWYWCNRCLPAVERGQKNFRPVLFAFLEINFSHLRAIKALDIRRREVNYLLMQSGLWTWLRFVIMLKVKDILILLFTCHWAIYHDVKGFLHYSGFDIVCKTRWSKFKYALSVYQETIQQW